MKPTMKPTIKPRQATTIHRDGSISLWDVHAQQWRRLPANQVSATTLATLPQADRDRIYRAAMDANK